MGKMLGSVILLLMCQALNAASKASYETWRSTEVNTAILNTQVATGAIVLRDLTVINGVPGESTFVYSNSSATGLSVSRTTSPVYNIKTQGDYFRIDEILTFGLNITQTGTATIRARWDWLVVPPSGKEKLGLRLPQ